MLSVEQIAFYMLMFSFLKSDEPSESADLGPTEHVSRLLQIQTEGKRASKQARTGYGFGTGLAERHQRDARRELTSTGLAQSPRARICN